MPFITIGGIPCCDEPGVYSITCVVTGKRYVGSSDLVSRRLKAHRSMLRRGTHDNQHLQRAWDKYGEKTFKFSVLELCEVDSLVRLEQVWINRLRSFDRAVGFNICRVVGPPMLGRKHSEASRKKMSQSKAGRPGINSAATAAAAKANTGKKRPRDVRERIGQSQRGKAKSQEHRDAIKRTHWTKRPDAAAIIERTAAFNRGKRHSPEHRQKIAEGLRRYREGIVHGTTS